MKNIIAALLLLLPCQLALSQDNKVHGLYYYTPGKVEGYQQDYIAKPSHNYNYRYYYGWAGNFGYDDYYNWSRGYWRKIPSQDREIWLWTVNGISYYYSQPIYPYPIMTIPSEFYYSGMPINKSIKYYCPSNANYYPYTPSCADTWIAVKFLGLGEK